MKITRKTLSERQRAKIDKDVEEYLSRGGTISTVDHTANHSYNQPIKRSRKEQIKYKKRCGNKIQFRR